MSTQTVVAHDRPPRVVFTARVADEAFALPVAHIQTVFHLDSLTRVPLCPKNVLGLAHHRGVIFTVLSMRCPLGLEETSVQPGALLMGVRWRDDNFALVVDDVGDVVHLDPHNEMAVPAHVPRSRAALIDALYVHEGELIPVLNPAMIFDFTRVLDAA